MDGIELIRKSRNRNGELSGLPILYQTFLKTYSTGREALNIEYFRFDDDLVQLTSVTYFGADNYENSISHFLSIEELEIELKRYAAGVDEFHTEGFIKIGIFDMNDTILLGVNEDNKDTIWKLNGDWGDGRPMKDKMNDSIFEFVNSFRQVVIKMNLHVRRVDEARLYRKWNEGFWRIRDQGVLP